MKISTSADRCDREAVQNLHWKCCRDPYIGRVLARGRRLRVGKSGAVCDQTTSFSWRADAVARTFLRVAVFYCVRRQQHVSSFVWMNKNLDVFP